ncbi:PspC domain-containing protein [Nocardioides sp.]|uniref:PspC domain-containing protein n=1 Tax=Nocardioides sp. TaxID=35761 RepID=UPI0026039ACA|nr:PspC domain-containing protein [Nocardioides sp.]MCW2737582.1 Phage shock protein (PspC) family protein [Nocardioides sp.]
MDNASTEPTTGTATGASEQPTPPPTGPRVDRDQMRDLGRLRRSVTDRHIAGVSGGIARHLDVDPIIVRVALVVAAFFGGAGLLAYVGAWILVPEEGTDDQPLGLDERSRSLALAGVGVLALLCAVGDWAGAFWFPWPLAIVAALAVWFLHRKDRSSPGRSPRQGYDYGHGYGYGYDQPVPPGGTAASETSYAAATDDPTAPPTYGPVVEPAQWGEYTREPRRPRNPRRRGPILFFFTLALVALAEGVLGVVDLAGASVADSAYPALALGLIATMLLVGSFWGRAGGLIALGVVAAVATAGATLGNDFPDDRFDYAPTSAAQVEDSYDFGGGVLTLDLSDVSDVDALDGRDIAIDGVGGRVEVIVPDGMDISVTTQVVAGDSRVFDRQQDGFDVALDNIRDGGDQVPDMSIAIDLVAGEIIVREAA